mgnify:CR=1 FL=1
MTEYISNSFAMFSEEGDKKVGEIVMSAILGECNWEWVEKKLMILGSEEATEEATDTAVRDAVWCRLEAVYAAKKLNGVI